MKIKVSVIMSVYNAEKYLKSTIDSVLKQTFKDFELIIVNDASRDNTGKLIKQYRDERIVYIEFKKNKGVSFGRNYGIELSKGDFLAFIDGDDVWYRDKLEKQIAFMETYSIDFCYSEYKMINEEGKALKVITKLPRKVTYKELLKTNSIPLLTVIINSNLMKKHKFIDIHHEDYVAWLNILKSEGIAAKLYPAITANYRIRYSSVSGNKFRSVFWTWNVYRKVEGLSLLKTFYFFICNIYFGLLKHQRFMVKN